MVRNRLKEILEQKGLKQKWLGEQCNIEKSTMSNIINNVYQPSLDTAFAIAYALNIRIDEIFLYSIE